MTYDSEVLADSPLGYWKCEETSGTTLTDSSGNSHNGTINGSPTLNAATVMPTGTGSITLDSAATKYLDVAVASWMNTNTYSVEAWVKLSSLTSYHNVFNRDGFLNRGWNIYFKDGQLSAFDGVGDHVGSATITTSTVAHVVVTVDATNVRVYLNGTQDFTFSTVNGWASNVSISSGTASYLNGFEVGSSFSGGGTRALPLTGNVDYVAYYGSTLSSTRVTAHYNAASGASSSSGTGSIALSGSGSASGGAAATGSVTLSASAAASGAVTGSGSISFSASGTGLGPGAASGSGSLSLSGAAGSTAVATGSGSVALTAVGTVSAPAAGSGFIALSGSMLGTLTGAGAGAISLDGSGTASAPAVAASGTAHVTLTAAANSSSISVVIYGGGDTGGSAGIVSETIGASTSDFQIEILDDVIRRAPSSITVVVSGGRPDEPITFKMDSGATGTDGPVDVYTTNLDSEGSLGPTSLTVIGVLGGQQGTRTLTATQLAGDGSTVVTTTATYTVRMIPTTYPAEQNADAQPVTVPGMVINGVQHFVFQDLLGVMDGGIGSYVMPMNPAQMTSPHYEYAFTSRHTTAHSGKFHVFQAGSIPKQWQLTGSCVDEAMQEAVMAYRALNRRFWLIDHRNRAWKVVFVEAQFVPRLRTNYNNVVTDWFSDYTLSFIVLDQEWSTPA